MSVLSKYGGGSASTYLRSRFSSKRWSKQSLRLKFGVQHLSLAGVQHMGPWQRCGLAVGLSHNAGIGFPETKGARRSAQGAAQSHATAEEPAGVFIVGHKL